MNMHGSDMVQKECNFLTSIYNASEETMVTLTFAENN